MTVDPRVWDGLMAQLPRICAELKRGTDHSFSDVEDAVSQALYELVRVNRTQPPEPSKLMTRARSRVRNEHRRRVRERRALMTLRGGCAQATPEEVALHNARVREVGNALEELPAQQRADLLGHVAGFRDTELAGTRSVDSVVSSRAHARKHLRERVRASLALVRFFRPRKGLALKGLIAAVAATCLSVPLAPPGHATPPARFDPGWQRLPTSDRAPQVAPGMPNISLVPGLRPTGAAVTTKAAGLQRKGVPAKVDTVLAAPLSDGHGDSGGGEVDYRRDQRSPSDEVLHCIEVGPSLDPHHAGCPV